MTRTTIRPSEEHVIDDSTLRISTTELPEEYPKEDELIDILDTLGRDRDLDYNMELTPTSPLPFKEPEPRTFLRVVGITPTTTKLNFLAYLVGASAVISFFVFLDASQGFLLSSVLNIPKTSLGTLVGSLAFYHTLLSVFLMSFWGALSDIIGRRVVYSCAFLVMGVALFLHPLAMNYMPQLVGYRVLFAVGGSAATAMLTTILADYAVEETRGKASAVVGIFTGLGALFALFVFLRLPTVFENRTTDAALALTKTYKVVASVAVAVAFIVFFGMAQRRKSKSSSPFHQKQLLHTSQETSLSISSKYATFMNNRSLIFRTSLDSRVFLGYFGGYLARSASVMLTLFLPLWIHKYYITSGQCPDYNDGGSTETFKETCRDAYMFASALSGVGQLFAILGAPVVGILADRFERRTVATWISLLGTLGFALLYFVVSSGTGVKSWMSWLAVVVVGFSQIGHIVVSMALVTCNEYVDTSIRGSIAGIYSMWGALGVVTTTKLGGYLFDHWNEGGPFLIALGANLFVFVVGSILGLKNIVTSRRA